MGPSGAGKSTLLDVLAGRKDPKNVTGTIYLNGKSGQNVKFVSTYVMQDDALMGKFNHMTLMPRSNFVNNSLKLFYTFPLSLTNIHDR